MKTKGKVKAKVKGKAKVSTAGIKAGMVYRSNDYREGVRLIQVVSVTGRRVRVRTIDKEGNLSARATDIDGARFGTPNSRGFLLFGVDWGAAEARLLAEEAEKREKKAERKAKKLASQFAPPPPGEPIEIPVPTFQEVRSQEPPREVRQEPQEPLAAPDTDAEGQPLTSAEQHQAAQDALVTPTAEELQGPPPVDHETYVDGDPSNGPIGGTL